MNISIIVPVKETDISFIKQKLDSIIPLNRDMEIIFVDGGCSEDVNKYLEFMADGEDHIHYLLLNNEKRNIPFNMSIGRNTGAEFREYKTGKYLCFTDVDIEFNSDILMELYNIAEQKQSDITIGSALITTQNGTATCAGWENTATWFSLIRQDFFNHIGGFNERFAGHYGYDDLEFLIRAKKFNAKITYTEELSAYMARPDKGTFDKSVDLKPNMDLLEHLINTYDYVIPPENIISYPGLLTYKDLQVLIHYALNAKVGTLEIGAFAGKSALAFLTYSKVPHCSIDNYYFDFNVYTAVNDDGSIIGDSQFINKEQAKKIYEENILHKFFERVHWGRLSSDDMVKHIKDNSFSVLFIDGDHTYEQVKKDFENYMPKLTQDGVIIFHDYKNEAGVHQFVDSLNVPNMKLWGLCAIIKKEDLK